MTSVRPAPPHWRRRMGTAVVFLALLDIIILVGVFGGGARIEIAAVVTVVVLLLIAMIWVRNSRLEAMAGPADGSNKD
jgi:TRAP-type C4-dicarboxylate transport system permease large subunit